jgi:hypothetical protein
MGLSLYSKHAVFLSSENRLILGETLGVKQKKILRQGLGLKRLSRTTCDFDRRFPTQNNMLTNPDTPADIHSANPLS